MTERISIEPPSRDAWLALRVMDVTSTESSALFGESPYGTAFELWHSKRDKVVTSIDQNERMDWGNGLQDSIALVLAKRYGVKIQKLTAYMRLPDARMGASFDFEIIGVDDNETVVDHSLQAQFNEFGPGLLEIKNVDRMIFKDQWAVKEDKSLEAPGHIEIQLQHQLHVRDNAWGVIGVLVGGNTGRIIVRSRDIEVGDALEARIRQLWAEIAAGTEPQPVFPGDAEFVCKLYGYAEPGKVFDGRGDETLAAAAAAYREAADREKIAKEDKKVAHAQLLAGIGECERAVLDEFNVWAGLVGPAHVEYDRDGYRGFKLTAKKVKAS